MDPLAWFFQGTIRAQYDRHHNTIHEFENQVITKDNIDEMVYARREKDNKTFTQVIIVASVICFWWPLISLICLAASYYTSEKVFIISSFNIVAVYVL